MLDPLEPVLRRLLEEWPQIKAPRVTEILRDDYGYAGSVDLVRKRLAALRPRAVRPAQRTGYRPGQVLQVDWAEMPTRPRIAGRERRVYALVCSLPYSGASTAHFTLRHDDRVVPGGPRPRVRVAGRRAARVRLRQPALGRRPPRRRRRSTWNPRFLQLRGHYALPRDRLHAGDAAREGLGRGRGALPQDRVLAGAALRIAGRARRALRRLARPGRAAAPSRDRPLRRRRAARREEREALRPLPPVASTRPGAARSRVPLDGYLQARRLLLPRARGARSSARRAALRPRPGLDRAPRPRASRATRAATSTGIWQPAPRMRPEPPPVAPADPDRRARRSRRRR